MFNSLSLVRLMPGADSLLAVRTTPSPDSLLSVCPTPCHWSAWCLVLTPMAAVRTTPTPRLQSVIQLSLNPQAVCLAPTLALAPGEFDFRYWPPARPPEKFGLRRLAPGANPEEVQDLNCFLFSFWSLLLTPVLPPFPGPSSFLFLNKGCLRAMP